MAAGDLITTDYQYEYNGVLFGSGTLAEAVEVDGLDRPALRVSDVVRPRDHGEIAGVDWLGGRDVGFVLDVGDGTATNLKAMLDSLANAGSSIGQTEVPLVFQLPGYGKRRVNARFRRRSFNVNMDYFFGLAQGVALEFHATDPRIYDNTLSTAALTLPSVSGGLGWPVSWPLGWGSAVGGLVNVTNAGTFATRPVITFIGPLTAPSVQNVTAGQTWACTFDLQSGDQLIVDFAARTVLLNGTASRYSYVTSSSVWWELAPGTSQLQLGATAGNGSASVAFRSAWL